MGLHSDEEQGREQGIQRSACRREGKQGSRAQRWAGAYQAATARHHLYAGDVGLQGQGAGSSTHTGDQTGIQGSPSISWH